MLRDILAGSVGSLAVGAILFGYSLILARLLGPGSFSLFQSLMGILGLALVAGMPLNLSAVHLAGSTQDPAEQARRVGAAVRAAMGIGAVAGAALLIFQRPLSAALHAPNALGVVGLAAAVFCLLPLVTLQGGIQGRNRYGVFALLRLAEAVVAVTVGLLLIRAGMGAAGAMAGFAAALGLDLCALLLWPGQVRLRRAGGLARAELRALARPVATSVALMMVCNVPMLVARARLPEAEAAGYAALFALRYSVLALIEAVAWPLYSRTLAGQGSPQALRRALLLALLPAGAFIAAGLVAPHAVLSALYGEGYTAGAHIMPGYGLYLALHGTAMIAAFHAMACGTLSLPGLLVPLAALSALWLAPIHSAGGLVATQCAAWALWLAFHAFGRRRDAAPSPVRP